MPLLKRATPKYRRHRASGRAVVTINGHDHYLGPYGSKASKVDYDRIISEWLAAGRFVPQSDSLTINELCLRYFKFAQSYYVPGGGLAGLKCAIRILRRLYGDTLAGDFGPLALKVVREKMVAAGQSRRYINGNTDRLRNMFRWAVAEELLSATVLHALQAVPGLRKGHTQAREPAPVLPVAEETVDATLPYLPQVVADMIRFQRLTGCRPGEVCQLRPGDVDRSKEIWEYRPAHHKTEHHGKVRTIYIGPQAQAVLRPYLLRDAEGYCFSPRESELKRHKEMRAARKTPVQPSQVNRRKRRRLRSPADHYGKDAFNRAIRRGVDKANEAIVKAAKESGVEDPQLIANWHPNQLRHSRATEVRRQFGLEAAQVVLGHSRADVTQVYAERDTSLAVEVMRKIG
jgi:integrase